MNLHSELLIIIFLSRSRWFYGKLSRFEAQNHLMAPGNEEGAFLVRQSEKDDIGYVLSGKWTGRAFTSTRRSYRKPQQRL